MKTCLLSGNFALDTIVTRDYPNGFVVGKSNKFTETIVAETVGNTCGNVACMLAYLGVQTFPIAHLDLSEQGVQIKSDLKRYGADVRFVENSASGGTTLLRCTHKRDKMTGEHIASFRAISGVQPMSRQQMRIAQIKSFVNCNYMHKISIDEIASHIGMSRSSFCSFFKRETGQTFTEYLNEKRIELACELLENKETNINEVGQAVGIPDTPYFCRFFKTIKGVTPTEYRNRVKKQIVIWQQ